MGSKKGKKKTLPKKQQAQKQASVSLSKKELLAEPTVFHYVILVVVTLAVGMGIRLFDAYHYDVKSWTVSGEQLMTSADSYFWLAGAVGVGRATDVGLAKVLEVLHGITGASMGDLGFWLPVFLAPLVAIPICLLCFACKSPFSALSSGVFCSSAATYFYRTRLGRYDTDLVALLFPVAMAVALILITLRLKERSVSSQDTADRKIGSLFKTKSLFIGIVLLGLWGRFYLWFYPQGAPLLVIVIGSGVVALLFTLRSSLGLEALLSYGLCCLVALSPLPVYVTLPVALPAVLFIPQAVYRVSQMTVAGAIVTSVVVIGVIFYDAFIGVFISVFEIVQTFAQQDDLIASGSTKIPSVFDCIQEFNNLSFSDVHNALGQNLVCFILGLTGFFFLVWKRPLTLILVPFLALGLAGLFMGSRFSLYGVVPIGVGIGLGMSWFLSDRFQSGMVTGLYNVVILFVIVGSMFFAGQRAPIKPQILEMDAKVLQELRSTIPEDSRLWIWWGLGYAAQYYAERPTFADGGWGKESNWKIYPLSFIYSTSSPKDAHAMIRYVSAKGRIPAELSAKDFGEAMERISEQVQSNDKFSKEGAPQYFVVTLYTFNKSNWIAYYGNWNLEKERAGINDYCSSIQRYAKFNLKTGEVGPQNAREPIDSLDVIDRDGSVKRFSWNNDSGRHIVACKAACIYSMKSEMYDSLMVRMLIGDPERFKDYFELVAEDFPWIRVYRVK